MRLFDMVRAILKGLGIRLALVGTYVHSYRYCTFVTPCTYLDRSPFSVADRIVEYFHPARGATFLSRNLRNMKVGFLRITHIVIQ